MIYFEYHEHMVDAGFIPSILCASGCKSPKAYMLQYVRMADRVFEVQEGFHLFLKVTELKNRFGEQKTFFMKSEDALALKLRAVLI